MIAAWMLYGLLVSGMLALGAWLLEGAVRMRGGPVRFLWLGALAATLALVALAPLRMDAPAPAAAPAIAAPEGSATTAAAGPDGLAAMAAQLLGAVRDVLGWPLRQAAESGDGALGRSLAAGWGLFSLALLVVAAVTALRARRTRRAWPRAEIGGQATRVAPGTGPAVLGIFRPEIVVPAWLLRAPEDEQRLVVLHEREHLCARDPLLLAAGCVAAALLPWSPAAWWMLLRLRAAVELDCDARVLRGGVPRRAYGTLLIDMAGREPWLFLSVPAFAGAPSTLERRLRAMNTRLSRPARARAGALGILGFILLAGACDTPLPTSAEVEKMDVAALEARTVAALPAGSTDGVTYFVDDRQVTAAEAHALAAGQIARMDVSRGAAGVDVIRIYTQAGAAEAGAEESERRQATRGTLELRREPRRTAGTMAVTSQDPVVVIDGVMADNGAIARLSPDEIAQVDVIKGAAATALYPNDPRVGNGVIRIVTKAAAGPQ
ncbi:MAG TPA: M56 family metallopeptidase [Longimicrobium sp.]|nr:M56 family metallopeptidase [Longimicrobium sp.]